MAFLNSVRVKGNLKAETTLSLFTKTAETKMSTAERRRERTGVYVTLQPFDRLK